MAERGKPHGLLMERSLSGKRIVRNAECSGGKGCSKKQMPGCNGLETVQVFGTKVSPLRTRVKW